MLLNTITKTLNIVGKKKCFNILILSLILTIFEIFGVALILPLIDILLTDNDDFIYKYSFLNLDKISKTNLIKYSLIFFIMFFLLKTFLSIFVNRIFVNLVYNLRTLIQKTLLTNFVYQEYNFHLKKNSSELINIISNEVNNFCGSNLLPLMSLVSEGLIVVGLLTLMLWYEPIGFMYAIVTLLIPAMIFYRISKKKQKALGIFRNFYDVLSLKHLQQVIFGIREVKISTTEDIFIREYSDNINNSANSIASSLLWTALTKIFLEFLIIVSITTLIVFLVYSGKGKIDIISLLGLFGLSVFRLLPGLNRVITSLQQVSFTEKATDIVHTNINKLSDLKKFKKNQITLEKNISLKNIYFKYSESGSYVLENVNLEINKGELIAILGPSGSGKSTLLDLISGLLNSSKGEILFDGIKKNQDQNIFLGYVSQNIFLIDDTIENNIAFGVNKETIDRNLLNLAIKNSQLEEFIKTLPDGLNTIVGERGTKISGGQKQRIGIARALYGGSNLLIFDEATNALDVKTDDEFQKIIRNMKGYKTVLFITHKKISLRHFDKVYEIKNKKVNLL